jgi:hypothetical protein
MTPVAPPPERAKEGHPAITAWCPSCQATVIPMDGGRCQDRCGWCDAFVAPVGLDDTIVRLRRRGLSYASIALVGHELFGWRLTRHQIRHRLHELSRRDV